MIILPKNKIPNFFRKIFTRFDDFITSVRNIPRNTLRVLKWIPIIWNTRDWDFCYLLEIIKFQIKQMRLHIIQHNILADADEIAQQMQDIEDIIQRYSNDTYLEKEEEEHHTKWGKLVMSTSPVLDAELDKKYGPYHRIDFYRTKAREQGKEEQERKESHKIWDRQEKAKKKDLDNLFKNMRKYIERWWD